MDLLIVGICGATIWPIGVMKSLHQVPQVRCRMVEDARFGYGFEVQRVWVQG